MIRAAFSTLEVAELYGVSDSHVRNLVKSEVLKKVPHLGKSVRISWDELEKVLGPLPPGAAA